MEGPKNDQIADAVAKDEEVRLSFLKACLAKLGLLVNQTSQNIPSVTPLHLATIEANGTRDLLRSLEDITLKEDGVRVIKGEHDIFRIVNAVDANASGNGLVNNGSADAPADPCDVIKTIIAHDATPPAKETPVFDFERFYASLETYRRQANRKLSDFGSRLMYAEVVTSTSTMLEKYVYPSFFTSCLPS